MEIRAEQGQHQMSNNKNSLYENNYSFLFKKKQQQKVQIDLISSEADQDELIGSSIKLSKIQENKEASQKTNAQTEEEKETRNENPLTFKILKKLPPYQRALLLGFDEDQYCKIGQDSQQIISARNYSFLRSKKRVQMIKKYSYLGPPRLTRMRKRMNPFYNADVQIYTREEVKSELENFTKRPSPFNLPCALRKLKN